MARMKAWVYRPEELTKAPLIRLEEVSVPEPGSGDILLEVLHASVCGTDEALFAGGLTRASSGVIPGHEVSGRVVAAGLEVTGVRPGDIVALESHYSFPGASGDGVIGLWPPTGGNFPLYNGGYAQFACVPAACAHPLPPELTESNLWLSLCEPAGNDYYLAQKVTAQAVPKKVAVFGCGPHGLYLQAFLSHFGVDSIAAFEIDPFRRRFARTLGPAALVLDPTVSNLFERLDDFTGGSGFDACIDMVGKSGEAFESCCRMVRDLGSVYLFGLFSPDVSVAGTPANTVIFEQQTQAFEFEGKTIRLVGVTGREGVWPRLIKTLSSSRTVRQLLMKPVTVLGPLDLLHEVMQYRPKNLLKAAFQPFERDVSAHDQPGGF